MMKFLMYTAFIEYSFIIFLSIISWIKKQLNLSNTLFANEREVCMRNLWYSCILGANYAMLVYLFDRYMNGGLILLPESDILVFRSLLIVDIVNILIFRRKYRVYDLRTRTKTFI